MLGNFFTIFVVCRYFSTLFSSKFSFRNDIGVSYSLDPDQARHYVRPDLGPNCLQRLSADDKIRRKQATSLLISVDFSILFETVMSTLLFVDIHANHQAEQCFSFIFHPFMYKIHAGPLQSH